MPREKRSNRLALTAAGKDTNDLTEAVTGEYQYVEKDDEGKEQVLASVTFAPVTEDVMTRAFAVFGFQTHCGNWVNKLIKTKGLEGAEVLEGIEEYRQLITEGGWTNRQGEATAGAGIFIEAYARYRGVEEERVRAAWETWGEDDKDAIKSDPEIKALVQRIRAERAEAKAAEARAKGGESKLKELAL